MKRRDAILSSAAGVTVLLLDACTSTGQPITPQVTLEQVKLYGDDVVDALLAAAAGYEATPGTTAAQKAVVDQIITSLHTSKDALDAVQVQGDARGIALQIVASAQALMPIVAPFLGPAAPFVPLGLAVIQAFIASLPPPPDTPPVPPPQLRVKAEQYRSMRRRQ